MIHNAWLNKSIEGKGGTQKPFEETKGTSSSNRQSARAGKAKGRAKDKRRKAIAAR